MISAEAMMQDYIFHFCPIQFESVRPQKDTDMMMGCMCFYSHIFEMRSLCHFYQPQGYFSFYCWIQWKLTKFLANLSQIVRHIHPPTFVIWVCRPYIFKQIPISFCFGREMSNILCKHHKNYKCCPEGKIRRHGRKLIKLDQ